MDARQARKETPQWSCWQDDPSKTITCVGGVSISRSCGGRRVRRRNGGRDNSGCSMRGSGAPRWQPKAAAPGAALEPPTPSPPAPRADVADADVVAEALFSRPRAATAPPLGNGTDESSFSNRRKAVSFDLGARTFHEVTPYAEVYGRHPRDFVYVGRGAPGRKLVATMAPRPYWSW